MILSYELKQKETNTMNFKEIIQKAKSQAKQLTIDISQIGDGKTKEQLHGDSIELLLNINMLETLYNLKIEKNHGSSRTIKQD